MILEEGFHLLLALDEQRADLILLIGVETQGAGHVLELAVGVHAHGAAAGLSLGLILGCGVVLRESRAAGAEREGGAEGEGEELVSHWVELPPLSLKLAGSGRLASFPYLLRLNVQRGAPVNEVDEDLWRGDEGERLGLKIKKRATGLGSGETFPKPVPAGP